MTHRSPAKTTAAGAALAAAARPSARGAGDRLYAQLDRIAAAAGIKVYRP